jgi:hypothetical protein
MLIRFVKGIFEVMQDANSLQEYSAFGKEEITRGMIGDFLRKKLQNPERALRHLYKHPKRWFQVASGRLSFAKRIRLRIKMQTVAKKGE